MCEHLNEQEVKANKSQRDSIKYKQCEYLKNKIGQKFNGIISNVAFFGVFVELVENGCNGLISKDDLMYDNIFIDEENFCIKNCYNGKIYRLGDEITVEISHVDMLKKEIKFQIKL